jgi:hypothetical protein
VIANNIYGFINCYYNLERQIDKMVYELYELTPEEIEIVEGKI